MNRQVMCPAGKTDPRNREYRLPLWGHLRDAVDMMEKMVSKWLPAAIVADIGLELPQLRQAARLLGAVHDIGKATAVLQHNIMQNLP